jgi:DNA-binding winged helix-turn-helix (wHTH) protein/WD40 repeat protein
MVMKTKQFVFGPFKLDVANSLLLHHHTPIPLTPKAFDTLVCLVENSGRLVTREELMKSIWPDSFVEEANLTVNISLVRKALAELDDGRAYIETVPRKGYRFSAAVSVVEEEGASGWQRPEGTTAPLHGASSPLKSFGRTMAASEVSIKPEVGSGSERAPGEGLAREIISFPVPKKSAAPELIGFNRPKHSLQEGTSEGSSPAWKRRGVIAGAICLALIGLAAGWLLQRRPKPLRQFKQRRLTSFSPQQAVTAAAISTGSKFIAYANSGGLFIQVINTGETHPLQLPKPDFEISGISWFPDSAKLLVGGASPGDTALSLWIVPVIGAGKPVEIGPYPPGVVSTDGSEIASAGINGSSPSLLVMRSDGSHERTLVTGTPGEVFGGFSWSYGRKHLIFTRYRWDPQFRHNSGSIDSCDIATGKTATILRGEDFEGGVVSLRDGRIIYSKILGANPAAFGGEILEFQTDPQSELATGHPKIIATWNSPVTSLTANGSGTDLAVRTITMQHSVYVGNLEDEGKRLTKLRPVSNGSGRDDFPRTWTPDSQALLIDSNRYGRWEIFKKPMARPTEVPFAEGPGDEFSPWVSPDGAWVLYLARPLTWQEPEPVTLMRMPISGGASQVVLKAPWFSEWGLRFQCPQRPRMPCVLAQRRDGQIVFRPFDPENGFQAGWKDLGQTAYAADSRFSWSLAPNGLSLAWIYDNHSDNQVHVLPLAFQAGRLLPAGTVRRVPLSGESYLHFIVSSPGSNGWYVVTQRPAGWTLLDVNLRGQTTRLLSVGGKFAPDVFPSPDGLHLAFSQDGVASNVWLLRNY